jgi:flagella basal body P-ring formation protein FlgA
LRHRFCIKLDMRHFKLLLFCGWMWGTAWPVEEQTVANIRQAIAGELESIVRRHYQNFDIEVAPLDPRLRLPPCDQPLAVTPLGGEIPLGAVAVEVKCQGKHAWTIYARANVRTFQQVARLARPLPKGTVLDQDMVVLEAADTAALRQGYFTNLDAVWGRRLKTSLPKGAVLHPQHLETVKMINKGDAVTIRVNAGALDVRMGGHALMDGELGQKIKVLNDSSQKVVEGIVSGASEVLVVF